MIVEVDAAVDIDLTEAFDHYETQLDGLGVDFLEEFRRAVDLIIANPGAWHLVEPPYRRCRFHRFPYGILYRVDQTRHRVIVLAVMHLARRPEAWRRRMN